MKKIAVFAGSFDPFTRAHEDLVRRGLHLFDEIIIAIGVNSAKKGLMPFDDREAGIAELFKQEDRVVVRQFTGLTVSFCTAVGARYMLRGLRNGNDFEFENAIAQNNLLLAPAIETYFLLAKSGLGHISSTIVRDIFINEGDVSGLVPYEILSLMKK
ncbi:pantetheine-phosphate adenylyltransferase [Sphingobacterium oryzagri]|uniref:Phosphopantetheine adenylyltransferase n=1 Tax=Sphingobacterium oryzagri TaxID=3025669 RepID=A0ABY7WME0_9SPHI|nr:pantetheine-phosphate adenylyltransferase [Sphingobacterium sp. KACC 22765]WDF70670.1 pantetheine-phosphate adenylyltransferase [Sphingobacterium sp. KACC 22765]